MTLAIDKLAWSGAETPAARHVAIIMDGNGRWAAERGLPRAEGHRQGVESVRRTVRAAIDARHHPSHPVQLLLGELVAAAARDPLSVRAAAPLRPARPRRPS